MIEREREREDSKVFPLLPAFVSESDLHFQMRRWHGLGWVWVSFRFFVFNSWESLAASLMCEPNLMRLRCDENLILPMHIRHGPKWADLRHPDQQQHHRASVAPRVTHFPPSISGKWRVSCFFIPTAVDCRTVQNSTVHRIESWPTHGGESWAASFHNLFPLRQVQGEIGCSRWGTNPQ